MVTGIIGILNITPDSFSDGGLYLSEEVALRKARSLIDDGVDVIDIGAESTRPNASKVHLDEELRRIETILPKVIRLAHKYNVLTSIDSYKSEVIKFAIDSGIDIINDQKGLDDDEKISLVAKHKKKAIVMHSLTVPTNRSINLPDDADVIDVLQSWITDKIIKLRQFGIEENQIIFDPGLGFGKTFPQCFEIIKRIGELQSLSLCVGHSRKGFLRSIGNPDAMTLAASMLLMEKGVSFIRVHDVDSHRKLRNYLL